jgi:hypothetical protein
MNRKTVGENALELFCMQHNIVFEKIMEADYEKPDYILTFEETFSIVVEVKDIETNVIENQAIIEYDQKGFAVWDVSKPGYRIKNKIEGAKKQLCYSEILKLPSVLLLFDNRENITKGIYDYEISTGMYGIESRNITENKIQITHGYNKKLSANEFTFVTYVGYLNHNQLIFYENYYGKRKLNRNMLKKNGVCVKYGNDPEKGIVEWKEQDI